MTQLLTADQMKALERDAIESGAVTGAGLMESAGQGVVTALFSAWPALRRKKRRALVLCGPGNNGGDGYVIARLLAEKGWDIDLLAHGDKDNLPADARLNHDRLAADHPVLPLTLDRMQACDRPDVIVDSIFGTGLTRPLPTRIAAVLSRDAIAGWARAHKIRRVAVDCPSGLDLDTGQIHGRDAAGLVGADLTVTFHSPKLGHYLGAGPSVCGRLEVVDIGIVEQRRPGTSPGWPPDPDRVRLAGPGPGARKGTGWPLSLIAKARKSGHKYDHGHVVVFSGGVGRGGAGRLAARAALRAGAGLVTLVCPPAALRENAARLDAVMLRTLRGDQPLERVADARVTGFCLGPGMGVTEATRARVLEVLARRSADAKGARAPVVVLDADALTSFEGREDALFAAVHARTILTPHDGEFARLFPDLSRKRAEGLSKTDAARAAAKRAGCIVLLKGADTVIAEPGGGASLHSAAYGRAAPWLATAGAGDVLAGLIAGLAAPDGAADLFCMAEAAAWLHVECARTFGPGLIAEDLPEQLPRVLRGLKPQAG